MTDVPTVSLTTPTGSVHAALERLVAALATGLRAEPPMSEAGTARHTVTA